MHISSRGWVGDKDSGVIIIEGMVKTSQSYRKCVESKEGTEQRTESQAALNARNTFKKCYRKQRASGYKWKKKSQRKGKENGERISQKLRETFNERGGSTLLKVTSPVSQTLKNFNVSVQ